MEPIIITFDDEKMKYIMHFVKEHAEGRREEFGDKFNSIDYVCGAMAVYFALGLENKLPAAWVFRPLGGEDPFTGELLRPDHDRRAVELLKRRINKTYYADLEPKTGWLSPWGAYYPVGYAEHGNFAYFAEMVIRQYEEDNDLEDHELQYVFDGWLTLNFNDREGVDCYAMMNGKAALTKEQTQTLKDIITEFAGKPFAIAANKALRAYSFVREEGEDHWFDKE